MGSKKASDNHNLKVKLMRQCISVNYNKKQTVTHFESFGFTLSDAHYYTILHEAESEQYGKEALMGITVDTLASEHFKSLEIIKDSIHRLNNEIQQHHNTGVYVNIAKEGETPRFVLNEEHDSTIVKALHAELAHFLQLQDEFYSNVKTTKSLVEHDNLKNQKILQLQANVDTLTKKSKKVRTTGVKQVTKK